MRRDSDQDGERISRSRFSVLGVLLSIAFIVWQATWAVVTPYFRGPDEVQHFNSVLRMATSMSWPDPGEARIDSGVIRAIHEAGFMAGSDDHFAIANKTPLHGGTAEFSGYATPYYQAHIVPHSQRTTLEFGIENPTSYVDQMTQHPPLYYLITGRLLNWFGGTEWKWDRQLLFARMISILITVPLVPSVLYTSRKLQFRRDTSLAVGTTVFAIPQLVFSTSLVTNDALAIGAGALTIAGVAEAMFGKESWKAVIVAGFGLGLGLWSKGTFIPMGLVVFIAFLVNQNTGSVTRRLTRGLAAGLLGVTIGGYWWIRNLVKFGSIQPTSESVSGNAGENSGIAPFVRRVFRLFIDSSWGELGWLEWWLPAYLIGALALAATALSVIALVRGPNRMKLMVLLLYYPLAAAVVVFGSYKAFRAFDVVQGIQGRYLFPGVVGLLVVAGSAWAPAFEKRTPSNRHGTIAKRLLSGLVVAGVALFSLLDWFLALYPGLHHRGILDWSRWSLAAGVGIDYLVVLSSAAVLAASFVVYCWLTGVRIDARGLGDERTVEGENRPFQGAAPNLCTGGA
ncbi:MAG: DUF2142 domain-containing protein [Ancrocorticia sp.]|nr:DUF2142 domain-containing protein [Ancrocorticia sp.]